MGYFSSSSVLHIFYGCHFCFILSWDAFPHIADILFVPKNSSKMSDNKVYSYEIWSLGTTASNMIITFENLGCISIWCNIIYMQSKTSHIMMSHSTSSSQTNKYNHMPSFSCWLGTFRIWSDPVPNLGIGCCN